MIAMLALGMTKIFTTSAAVSSNKIESKPNIFTAFVRFQLMYQFLMRGILFKEQKTSNIYEPLYDITYDLYALCKNRTLLFAMTKLGILTHLCRMDFPILINWTSSFTILGLSGGIFHFYSNCNRILCK